MQAEWAKHPRVEQCRNSNDMLHWKQRLQWHRHHAVAQVDWAVCIFVVCMQLQPPNCCLRFFTSGKPSYEKVCDRFELLLDLLGLTHYWKNWIFPTLPWVPNPGIAISSSFLFPSKIVHSSLYCCGYTRHESEKHLEVFIWFHFDDYIYSIYIYILYNIYILYVYHFTYFSSWPPTKGFLHQNLVMSANSPGRWGEFHVHSIIRLSPGTKGAKEEVDIRWLGTEMGREKNHSESFGCLKGCLLDSSNQNWSWKESQKLRRS